MAAGRCKAGVGDVSEDPVTVCDMVGTADEDVSDRIQQIVGHTRIFENRVDKVKKGVVLVVGVGMNPSIRIP
jgi:hypothetical protein